MRTNLPRSRHTRSASVYCSETADGKFRSSPEQDFRLLDSALDFAVAWKFLYPMFRDAKTSREIDKNWPGFIAQVKDAFISLAVDGPFPD